MLRRPRALPLLLSIALLSACGRETPAPPTQTTTTATTATQTPVAPIPAPRATATPTYASAAEWYGRTRGFHFTMKSAEYSVEGELERTTPGAERVHFKHDGAEWIGATERTGVVWYHRANGAWTKAAAPPFADTIYQRATLWFDPQKKEGEAQKNGENGYRFTDANSGDRYDVTVDGEGRIAALQVEGARPFTMKITNADEAAKIEKTGK